MIGRWMRRILVLGTLGGLAYGLITPPTNIIVRGAPGGRHQGLLMSVKQVGVPIGAVVSGAALPTLDHSRHHAGRVIAADAVRFAFGQRARHGGELAFGLARRPFDGGERLARFRQHGLRLAPELAQPLLLGLGMNKCVRGLFLGVRVGGSGRARFGPSAAAMESVNGMTSASPR